MVATGPKADRGHELPPGHAAEAKFDGFRTALIVQEGRVELRSRRGADLGAACREIRQAAHDKLPAGNGLDGELVVWEEGRLAFERLQARGARAAASAREGPAHFAAFDLLHQGEKDLTA
ncbi:hypothetical protein [Kitasatospora sp. NPDC001547]|uniref:ATP-dependent DNA ligase n=1 Tax=Kitasatospora sp. NPDC001547 TaxID=3364015 RepID=UPI0036AB834F